MLKKIKFTVISKVSNRELSAEYTLLELLEKDEETIVEEITVCDCEPVGETYVIECNCCDEWDEYNFNMEVIS